MKYFFRRKREQIKRVIDFLPIIWKGHDFDFQYAIDLFKHQLQRQADYLESKCFVLAPDAKMTAQKIRTAIQLMEKVYNDEYEMEYLDRITQELEINNDPFDEEDPFLERWEIIEDSENQEEIDDIIDMLIIQANQKQNKAHRILWKFIEHNIRHWWY